MPRDDLTIRPLADAGELDLFQRLDYVLDDELADDLATNRRRPRWLWIATRDDRVLARAGWWGGPDDEVPASFDFFDVDDSLPVDEAVAVGVELVATALRHVVPSGATPPEYGRFIPPDWREDPAARQAVETRFAVLERLGARQLVERLRLEWRVGTPLPKRSTRLRFRAVADREELITLMTPVQQGTLDAHSQSDLASLSPEAAAAKHFDEEFAHFESPRDWWRVATLDDGEPVGFVIAARNTYNPIIAYLGVLPQHRGHGYVDDLLAEGTHILAAQDVPRIRAATDLANVPTARAFERAGYVNFARAVNFTWEH
ncbi:GNAT family N-acetyltransferase [Stackebrandtia nassauensis]|uniref:GCN5-related N-acetyltransferase n=1 Tax=Stackebrandtia nassauensis (strain DSM 44728 / CIP 108903 / NRRL B-16338 / NBRC 102104 / LLR-40K-21) TaxID=446470 RepID=D3Q196_STANL|nr:GNAT family N-acetyltransferase [Stackebrandtia nassauensis]ADD45676.1 GCN5-related N-acetyltransferase [Stackebrandtia nassauensis DSM 44728]